jgi:HlyD family secretion protein
LTQVPRGVLPDMSASAQILTGRRARALVIPAEALTIEGGQPYCYVAGVAGLVRSPVRVHRAGRDLLEVEAGLQEGDAVVLRPASLRERPGESLPSSSAISTAAR